MGVDPAIDAQTETRSRWRSAAASSSGACPARRHRACCFVASAAESGIDVFLLTTRRTTSRPADAAEAIREAAASSTAARSRQPSPRRARRRRAAPARSSARRARGSTIPEACSARAPAEPRRRAARSSSGSRHGLYCQSAGRNALAVALELGAPRRRLVACAVYPIALAVPTASGQAAAEALVGLGLDTGVAQEALWKRPTSSTSTWARRRRGRCCLRIAQCAPRGARPASAVDVGFRARNADGRLDEALSRPRGGADPGRGRVAAARRAHGEHRRDAGARERARRQPLRDDRRRAASATWSAAASARRRARSSRRSSAVSLRGELLADDAVRTLMCSARRDGRPPAGRQRAAALSAEATVRQVGVQLGAAGGNYTPGGGFSRYAAAALRGREDRDRLVSTRSRSRRTGMRVSVRRTPELPRGRGRRLPPARRRLRRFTRGRAATARRGGGTGSSSSPVAAAAATAATAAARAAPASGARSRACRPPRP